MEGILTLIIIIIVFNLFNFLARSLKGDPANRKDRVSIKKDELTSDLDYPGQIKTVRDEKDNLYDSFFDMQQNDYQERDSESTYSKEETARPVVEKTEKKVIEKKSSSVRLSGNLRQLLTQKDPLITAFIFHEIIDPPRTRRRKP